ncbi:MAG TPA: GrpB family protein [Vicinamibacterales bacterium]|jgi:GrpB-like predicted nucleotidyltransferase (UPF0157 family)|nr:GrpB family protein [Vicinamibacterales bacterium]
MPNRVVVVDYDPAWREVFVRVARPVRDALGPLAQTIEHVGSTSVPGLAAKPIVDISVVVATDADLPAAIERLAALGYRHQGDLGVEGREAFHAPEGLPPHNLYVCPRGSLGLVNQIAVRDHLRAHAEVAAAYAALKKSLAEKHPDDIGAYVEGKTDFVLGMLRATGRLTADQLDRIERANRPIPRVESR